MNIELIMSNKDGTSRSFVLNEDCTTIGRRRSCDLHVAIPTIEPVHCEITIKEKAVKLTSHATEGKTLHNNLAVDSADLKNLDTVTVGPVEFTVKITDEETVIRRL